MIRHSLLAIVLAMTPLSALAAERSTFDPGALIKAPGNPAVYYFAQNGKRYVFPNDKTYFTWYTNFSGVKTISSRALAAIPIGGNVTYRPGRKMVKIDTDPRVYVVDQGAFLRHVTTASIAESLYSISWKQQIDDIPDAFFTNYRLGTPIELTSDFEPSTVLTQTTTIAQDKQLMREIANITIGDMETSFVPGTITLKKDTTITWTNRDIYNHTVKGNGWESGWIAPGQSYSRKFSTTGAFDYICSLHPSMQGTINIVP